MALRKKWIWIVVIFLGMCVVGLMAVAGAGVYFVASAIVQSYFTGPGIAGNTAGQFVVAWAHRLATPAIEARRLLRDYIFGDGFERGSIANW